MKKVHLFLMLFTLIAKLGVAQPGKPGSWWAVMAEGNVQYSDCTVYIAAENEKLKFNGGYPTEYRCVLPGSNRLFIEEIHLIDSTTINLFINLDMPRKHDIAEFLKNSGKSRYANSGDIRPFPIISYQIKFGNKVLYTEDVQMGIDEIGYVRLTCPDAPRVEKLLKSGKEVITIKVDYWEKFKLTNICKISANQIDTMQFVKDFFSPVENNTITAAQIGIASRIISSKLIADCEQIGSLDESADRDAQAMREILFKQVSAYMNAALESMGRKILIPLDFSEERYASDFDTEIAYDAKNMSKEQFRKKYHKEDLDKSKKERIKKGGGGIGIVDIFNITGKGEKKSFEAGETHKIFSKDDAWQSIMKDSYEYEWKGGKYYPKSIIAYEDLSDFHNINFDFNHRSSSYAQSKESKIFHVRVKTD